MYHIEMNVYDEDYIEDQYLLLGVFHAVLYGDRCIMKNTGILCEKNAGIFIYPQK